jgi:hypothetical protein
LSISSSANCGEKSRFSIFGSFAFSSREPAAPSPENLERCCGIEPGSLGDLRRFGERHGRRRGQHVVDELDRRAGAGIAHVARHPSHRLKERLRALERALVPADHEDELLALRLQDRAGDWGIEVIAALRRSRLCNLARHCRRVRARIQDHRSGRGCAQHSRACKHHFARRRVIRDHRDDELRAAHRGRDRISDLEPFFGERLCLGSIAVEAAHLVSGRVQIQSHPRSHRAQSDECHGAHVWLSSRQCFVRLFLHGPPVRRRNEAAALVGRVRLRRLSDRVDRRPRPGNQTLDGAVERVSWRARFADQRLRDLHTLLSGGTS